MTVGDHRDPLRTTTRRSAIVCAAWAAAIALALGGCSDATVASPSPSAASVRSAPSSAPSPAATPPATAASSARLTPVRIKVPTIGVDATLVRLGLTSDGALAVPTTARAAGWFTGSPVPGRIGPAIIAGHVHWNDDPAVFARLGELTRGDGITITRSDGSTAAFTVDRIATFAKTEFPTALVYGPLDFPGLRLITCGGYDPVERAYETNVIVFATISTP